MNKKETNFLPELDMIVFHEDIYDGNESMTVVGIRKEEVELEGDYSGGTHAVNGTSWMPRKGLFRLRKVCENHIDGKGCPLPNVHCAYPNCEPYIKTIEMENKFKANKVRHEYNNKIAELMEIRFHDNKTVSGFPTVFPLEMGITKVGDFKFNSSFDWQIPLLKKLISILHERLNANPNENISGRIKRIMDGYALAIVYGTAESGFEIICQAIDYIQKPLTNE